MCYILMGMRCRNSSVANLMTDSDEKLGKVDNVTNDHKILKRMSQPAFNGGSVD